MKIIQSLFLFFLVITFFFTDGIKDRALWIMFDISLFYVILYFLKLEYFKIFHYVFVLLLLFSSIFFIGNEFLMKFFPIPKTNEPVMTYNFVWVILPSLVLSPILLFVYHKYITPKCSKISLASIILFAIIVYIRILVN